MYFVYILVVSFTLDNVRFCFFLAESYGKVYSYYLEQNEIQPQCLPLADVC